ncbi:DNA replication ATP-dependent helicase/nuclease DNA2 [Eurosta solidaginis]|uniref:DNA replication ATP-dependent helicase/nuclease DNA2 n=1 Tax=Eurosta solidaginis TaxID=178769 RepID=UPI003530FDD7
MNISKRMTSPMKESNDVPTKKIKTGDNGLTCKEEEISGTSYDHFFDDDFATHCDFDGMLLNGETKVAAALIDLTKWQRCVVEHVERKKKTYVLVLHLRLATESEEHEKENKARLTKCQLQKQWSQLEVKAGDIVSIKAVYDDALNCYKVDNEQGLCVSNPDTLISGTSVVGSLFCRRKAVLQDRFKGIDANSKIMVIGSMVHEFLQLVLRKQLRNSNEIEAAGKELLNSTEIAYELYGNLMTREELHLELQKFIPNVMSFVEQYIIGKSPTQQIKDTFSGTITEIQDIEENVWTPQLGLKGKIDVLVRIKRRQYEKPSNAIPLELKTGRATFSMEHKGQVILYQMMLSAIGRETQTGLLLYLREGILRELRSTHNEQRDLIMLRNELAYYTGYKNTVTSIETTKHSEDKYAQPLKLPDPISHHSACSNCEYATICCTFAKTDPELQLRGGHPLHAVIQTVTEHLRHEDYKYFMHWCGLLVLEEQEARKSNNVRALWTKTPEQRNRSGLAIIDLKLKEVVTEGGRYLNKFGFEVNVETENLDLLLSGFCLGEYVIVSTRKRLAVAAGCITDISSDNVTISLERDLRKNYSNDKFIIDKHESQSGNTFNFTNVSLLLDERFKSMREIVIQRKQPTYHKVLPKIIATEGACILKELNSVQRSAVLKSLTTESYMLIKGLPGTGKTQTLVAIVRLLHLLGKSILITSHTHSAVDNLLVRLKPYKLSMLRLGSGARVHKDLQEFGENHLLKDCSTVEAIKAKYNSYQIVGVTCLGSSHPLFLHRRFDFCIVDEATQVMQPTTLRPLFYCDKFVLVGDPDQLPPLIRSREARKLGADESLFERLDTETATSVLTLQYRMNKEITRLANELTYKGALQCASKAVEMNTFQLPFANAEKVGKWLQRALQKHINQAVFLLDTKDCSGRLAVLDTKENSATEPLVADDSCATIIEDSVSPSRATKRFNKYINQCEAAIIICILEELLKAGCAAERIGVIAPYRAQVELLRKCIIQLETHHKNELSQSSFEAIEVNTVDQYQGRDKDIIILSGTKTGGDENAINEHAREAEILEDKRRLTVAITRAKRKLLLVGDAACLEKYAPFSMLLSHIPSYSKLQLEDGKLGFEWKTILNKLNDIIKA